MVHPNGTTPCNVKTFTGNGKNKGGKCNTKMLSSYYHYFGGVATPEVIDDSYQDKDTKGLYISDGSVIYLF